MRIALKRRKREVRRTRETPGALVFVFLLAAFEHACALADS